MDNELFTSLRKYNISDQKDPIENFITEAFAWLLKNNEDFCVRFLKQNISNKNFDLDYDGVWSTQKNFDGYFPDMVYEFDDKVLVFEHKVWSPLHDKQIETYRDYAEQNYAGHLVILITGDVHQHEQNPNVALCWRDVYKMIDQWLQEVNETKVFLFRSFQNLLVNEGLGPKAPVSHVSIRSYYAVKDFKSNVKQLINSIYYKYARELSELINDSDDSEMTTHLDVGGRFGISFFKQWRPDVFIGFLPDWEDHCTKPLLGEKSPDFTIILSFTERLQSIYPNHPNYQSLISYLHEEIKKMPGWDFYHHIKDKTPLQNNFWHPIHIRKPMLELLRGTITIEQQEDRFMDAAREILPIIKRSKDFQQLRQEFNK